MKHGHELNRRTLFGVMASLASAALVPRPKLMAAADRGFKTGLGLVMYCCRHRRDHLRRIDRGVDLFEPTRFLEHCRELGAGGAQVQLGVLESAAAFKLRHAADSADLYIEAIVSAPREKQHLERFNAEMRAAAEAGAKAARTVIIPGRRYEYFDSLEMFHEHDRQARKSLELAAPIAETHRLPLAVENHKDHRDDQRIALLERISSEFVGACVDTGNSFALLEDPLETVRKFAPWAHSVHLKDQALQLYDDGFLLADIPLGQGSFDLKSVVQILRSRKPDIRFNLELITRDPLKVPVLTDKYWRTFPELPASDLARTLRYVRNGAKGNLQYITKMPRDEQLAREDANVRQSLDYARDALGI